MEDKVSNNYKNPVEDFVNKTSEEITKSFSANDDFHGKIKDTLKSIINEDEIKTTDEEVDDLNKVINDEVEAKKTRLAVKNWEEEHLEEITNYKKEEFKRVFEEEIKKANPNITEDQLSKSKEYANLVADNYFNNKELDIQKDTALNENSQLFGPGAMQNGWTDLQGMFNFLKKKPKEIKDIKDKYNSLKGRLKGVNLPSNLRQVSSLENIMSGLNNPDTNNLFSRTKKYMGWADRINKLTGGWLKKTISKSGEKLISKIGNQAIKEFATNSLNVLAKEGFQKGFTTVLNGVLKGGVEKIATKVGGKVAVNVGEKVVVNASQKIAMKAATRIASKLAVKGGVQAGLLATAGAASAVPVVGWIVAGALLLIDAALWLKKKVGKLAEKLGISTKRFFEENFGKVGGKIVKGLMILVGLPTLLIGAVSFVIVGPILIAIFGGISLFSLFQGGIISSLVPSKGKLVTMIVRTAVNNAVDNTLGTIVGEGCPSGWPTTGKITQGYATYGKSTRHGEMGQQAIDIARTSEGGTNTKIYATHEGRVLVAGWWPGGGGNMIIIEGSNCGETSLFTTKYYHMKSGSINVNVGQKVQAGTFLGIMGSTGNSTGVHLHYQIADWKSGSNSKIKIIEVLPQTPSFPANCLYCNVAITSEYN